MRIAQIAPIIERVPPKKYGGTERVVSALTEELVKLGHNVTLFASGDSITSAKLVSIYPKALREIRAKELYSLNILTMLHIGYAYSKQDQFDIIHDHTGYFGLPTGNIAQKPVVTTYHGPITPEVRRVFNTLRKPYLVTISKSQAKPASNLNHVGTVYNGLAMEEYPFSEESERYLLFVGRISLEKGVHNAIEVSQYLNIPLTIAAKLDDIDIPYFNEYVGPSLSEQIRWVGEVDETDRNKLMSKALCLLHPITWPEPFGLTMIEAMACGCPVIAFNRGSIPEIIEHGKTGFIVEDLTEMIEAVANIESIDRKYCREYALKNFNATKMALSYQAIYKQILQKYTKKSEQNPSIDTNTPLAL